jgi:hypothetical protein
MDVGWWVGGAITAVLAVYIWLVIEPSRTLMGAWIGVTLAAFYLSSRMTKEVVYGIERLRNSRATEAVPPEMIPPPDEPPQRDDDGPPRVNLRR